MQSLSFLVFAAFCLVVSDAARADPITVEPNEWHETPSTPLTDINLPNQKNVYMKTDLTIGSGTDLRINYKNNAGDTTGSFVLRFSSPPKYGFLKCTDFLNPSQDLPADLPAKDDYGYRIFKVETHGAMGLKISCNDELLITFEPSDAACTGWSTLWVNTWEKNKELINFDFDRGVNVFKISSLESAGSSAEQWKDKPLWPEDIEIPEGVVYLKTDKTIGSGINLVINYNNNAGKNAGGFKLQFSNPPKYEFLSCTTNRRLRVDLPAKDDDGFRIFKVETHGAMGLKISCNDELLITFEPSDAMCTGFSFWRMIWVSNKERIDFQSDYGVTKYKFSSTESKDLVDAADDAADDAVDDAVDAVDDAVDVVDDAVDVVNDAIDDMGDVDDNSITDQWKEKPFMGDIEIPNQADVYMKTDLTIGSRKVLRINYENSAGEKAGGFKLLFSDPPKYGFLYCTELTEANLDLPVDLPAEDDDGFRIFKLETHETNGLKISCNDELLITFEPSNAVCTGWHAFWRDTWENNKEVINFSFDDGVTKYKFSSSESEDLVDAADDAADDAVDDAVDAVDDAVDVVDDAVDVVNDAIDDMGDVDDNSITVSDQWKEKPFMGDIEIPNQADVYMKTDLTIGSRKVLRINYENSAGEKAGGFKLLFSDPPKYGFLYCTELTEANLDLPVDLPAEDDDGFRIFKLETHETNGLKISCNDELLITFEPSNAVCTGWHAFWRDTWENNKEVINFSFDDGVTKYKFSSSESEDLVDAADDAADDAVDDAVDAVDDAVDVVDDAVDVVNDAIDDMGDVDDNSITDQWKEKPFMGDIEIPNRADVYMKTDLTIGSRKVLRINYENSAGEKAGAFKLLFSDPPKYGFLYCTELTEANLDLPVDLPAEDDGGFRIFKLETHETNGLKISCNDELLITFEPSNAVCTGWHAFWRDTWENNKEVINFSFDDGVTKYKFSSSESEGNGNSDGGLLPDVIDAVDDGEDDSFPVSDQWRDRYFEQWIEIPNQADVYMKTDLTIGSRKVLRINYRDNAEYMNAGGFKLLFSDPPKYNFLSCMTKYDSDEANLDLPVDLPVKDDDGFRIFKVETHGYMGLNITCNDELLITFEPSNAVCTGKSYWREMWERKKDWINFAGDDGVKKWAFSRNTASLRSRSAYQYLAAIFVCYIMLF
ncbi:uncharacterized protein LOC134814094 isoform X3 [Bolinopsis microptera]|uniref:uncharacterized protein LOC134814094 isoform X3 n=1 Tax=Bolinopsis microptera TaxID=2820187 RepID=UPI00307A33F0